KHVSGAIADKLVAASPVYGNVLDILQDCNALIARSKLELLLHHAQVNTDTAYPIRNIGRNLNPTGAGSAAQPARCFRRRLGPYDETVRQVAAGEVLRPLLNLEPVLPVLVATGPVSAAIQADQSDLLGIVLLESCDPFAVHCLFWVIAA